MPPAESRRLAEAAALQRPAAASSGGHSGWAVSRDLLLGHLAGSWMGEFSVEAVSVSVKFLVLRKHWETTIWVKITKSVNLLGGCVASICLFLGSGLFFVAARSTGELFRTPIGSSVACC